MFLSNGGVSSFLTSFEYTCLSVKCSAASSYMLPNSCCFLALASWAMVARGLHCSSQEAETGRMAMSWSQFNLNDEFQASKSFIVRPCVNIERTGKATSDSLHPHCAVRAACGHCSHISVRCYSSRLLVYVLVSTLLRWTRQYQISGY